MSDVSDKPGAQLIVIPAGANPAVVQLAEILTIGRSPANELVLDDPNASRRHAEIRLLDGNRYRLIDMGSSNGTWLNGKRLTVPEDLKDGDQIKIGSVEMHFFAPGTTDAADNSLCAGTAIFLRKELVVVLVADIRNFTTMSEQLPVREFSSLISGWFQEASKIVEHNGGTVDKFIGDAIMAFWVATDRSNPASEIEAALETVRGLLERAAGFSREVSGQFPGHAFRIGIGLNMGDAVMGNVGTVRNQSFTIMGDSVNVAFRLESLSKEKGFPAIVGRSIADRAREFHRFVDLGQVEVKGRMEPVSICALQCDVESSL